MDLLYTTFGLLFWITLLFITIVVLFGVYKFVVWPGDDISSTLSPDKSNSQGRNDKLISIMFGPRAKKIFRYLLVAFVSLGTIVFYLTIGNRLQGCIAFSEPNERSHDSTVIRDYNHNLHVNCESVQLFYSEPLYDLCNGIVTNMVVEGKIGKIEKEKIEFRELKLIQEDNLTKFYPVKGSHRWKKLINTDPLKSNDIKYVLFIDLKRCDDGFLKGIFSVLQKIILFKSTPISKLRISDIGDITDIPIDFHKSPKLLMSIADACTNRDREELLNRKLKFFGEPDSCTLTPPKICDIDVHFN